MERFIDFVKKNRFWLLSGLIAAAMVGAWFYASAQLKEQTDSGTAAINTQVENAKRISNLSAEESVVGAHPNQSTQKGMESETAGGIDALIEAWRARVRAQESALVWPANIKQVRGFNEIFNRYDPPEKFPVNETGARFYIFLQNYQRHIPSRMDGIANIIKTRWMYGDIQKKEDAANQAADRNDSGGGSGGGGIGGGRRGIGGGRDGVRGPGGNQAAQADDRSSGSANIVVEWNELNQQRWNNKLTQFAGLDDNRLNQGTNVPSPLQMYMLQQDLWLMEAMFNIIAKVNDGATSNDFAPIKTIDYLLFGRDAMTQLGHLSEITLAVNPAASEADAADAASEADAADASATAAAGGFGPSASQVSESTEPFGLPSPMIPLEPDVHNSPIHGRYVNAKYEPYAAETVRSVLSATVLPEENLELVVARRIPVRIALVMDERKMADFIAACAESEFAFEIQQVRINRHPLEGQPAAGGGPAGGAPAGGGRDPEGRTPGTMGAGGMATPGGGRGGARGPVGGSTHGLSQRNGGRDDGGRGTQGLGGRNDQGNRGGTTLPGKTVDVHLRTNFDVAVEFYGVIKIYNPVQEWLIRGEPAPVEEVIPSTGDADPVVGDAGPEVAQPGDSQPAGVQPAGVQPAGAQPAGAQPAGAQPDEGQPEAVQSVEPVIGVDGGAGEADREGQPVAPVEGAAVPAGG